MVTNVNLKLANRIWTTQKRHPRVKFVGKDFTNKGTLSRSGKAKLRKK